jgi:ABC-2 type transport system permease protein
MTEPIPGETAATRRGNHDRLAALPAFAALPASADPRSSGQGLAQSGTLPLRVEFARQWRRRRTQLVGLLMLLLPLIIAVAFELGSASSQSDSGGAALVGLAKDGAGNFALFTEFASVGFLLVVIVALFCGDSVASEASWSSLRYLLALPVPRARLLRQKFTVALVFAFGVNLLLPGWAYVVGGVFFGWGPAHSPFGGSFTLAQTFSRLAIVVAYACGQALIVGSLAFLLSVLTDAPLAAVGGATFLIVISNIIDTITALDPYRVVLPTHFQYSWLDALTPAISWADMTRGTSLAVIYSAVFLALAWIRFAGKDITS